MITCTKMSYRMGNAGFYHVLNLIAPYAGYGHVKPSDLVEDVALDHRYRYEEEEER